MINETIGVLTHWLDQNGLYLSLPEYIAFNAIRFSLLKILRFYSKRKEDQGETREQFSACQECLEPVVFSERWEILRLTETVLGLTGSLSLALPPLRSGLVQTVQK